jgi:phosphoribosylglycinamide formyltransferase 1
MFRITILLSGRHGRGSNMAALAAACDSGLIPGAVVTDVIGSHRESPAIARAAELGLNTHIAVAKDAEFEAEITRLLDETQPDLICLAGFMRKLPATVLAKFEQRIVNTHPALLPSFGGKGMYGLHVHQAVLDHGCKVSGCTVHFVDEEFDSGPILMQTCVPVLDGDTAETLAARVVAAEHETYPRAVKAIAEGRVRVEGRSVRISP